MPLSRVLGAGRDSGNFLLDYREVLGVFQSAVHLFKLGAFLLLRAAVEEIDQRVTVVLLDHVDDAGVELVFHREVDAVLDVGDDDEGAHCRGERVVGVSVPSCWFSMK